MIKIKKVTCNLQRGDANMKLPPSPYFIRLTNGQISPLLFSLYRNLKELALFTQWCNIPFEQTEHFHVAQKRNFNQLTHYTTLYKANFLLQTPMKHIFCIQLYWLYEKKKYKPTDNIYTFRTKDVPFLNIIYSKLRCIVTSNYYLL